MMKKVTIGEKQYEIDENAIKPLSDDELEEACGGTGTGAKTYHRLVCDICQFKSWWGPNKAETEYLVQFHHQMCYGTLRTERQQFDSDPNQITD